jgi:hypothetical protein
MLLRVTLTPVDWTRLANTLETTGSQVLAQAIRHLLDAARPVTSTEPIALAFPPQQTAELQRFGATLDLSLLATPVPDEGPSGAWVTSAAERAIAVAAAEAIVRTHQRRLPA